eukprot:832920-Amphidinium_carterae.4
MRVVRSVTTMLERISPNRQCYFDIAELARAIVNRACQFWEAIALVPVGLPLGNLDMWLLLGHSQCLPRKGPLAKIVTTATTW